MQATDKAQFAQIVKATFAMNPKWRMPDKAGIELWWRCLEPFTIEQVSKGFQAHITDPERGQFQPMPADIIRHIEGPKETREAAAEYAWRRVMDALGSVGTYSSAVFPDPAIHYAIAVAFGSWERVGQTTEDEMPFRRQDFVKAYMAYRSGLPYPARLVGRFEREGAIGESRFEVQYIGDRDRCIEVERGGRSAISSLVRIQQEAVLQ